MPLLKTTWFTQLQRHSFTESWYRNASSPDPTIEFAAAQQYAQARAQILGNPAVIYGIRISNVDDKSQKAYLRYVQFNGNRQVDDQGNFLHGCAASNVSLNVEFQSFGNLQEKLLQLRGIWDDTELNGGVWTGGDPVYVPLINSWINTLVSLQYGWRYNGGTVSSNISGYTTDANGIITFTTAAPFFVIPASGVGKNGQFRISGNVNSPNLNGQITLKPLTTTTARSTKPISAFPFIAGATISYTTPTFIRAAAGVAQRLGKRQAGAPSLQSRGRGRVRLRG